MDNRKTMKIIGFACTAIGFGISLIQKQLDDKNLEEKIAREVSKKLTK